MDPNLCYICGKDCKPTEQSQWGSWREYGDKGRYHYKCALKHKALATGIEADQHQRCHLDGCGTWRTKWDMED